MKIWSVCFEVYASKSVQVQAETAEEARELAVDAVEYPTLCYHCSHEVGLGDFGEIIDTYEVK